MNVDPFMSSKRTEEFMPCQIFLMMGGEWGGRVGTRGNPNKSYVTISIVSPCTNIWKETKVVLYHRYSWLQDEAQSPKAKSIDTSLPPFHCCLWLDTNFVMDLITKKCHENFYRQEPTTGSCYRLF